MQKRAGGGPIARFLWRFLFLFGRVLGAANATAATAFSRDFCGDDAPEVGIQAERQSKRTRLKSV
jgi:hypothetical protein